MSINRRLVEQFKTLHQEKYNEYLSYDRAELYLKELAEIVRITAPKQEIATNDKVI